MNSAIDILKQYWGFNTFRPLQKEIIDSVIEGKDTFAVLPTGGGKSVCYQIPALMKDGVTVVVSPLIALMRDQVTQLQKRGIKAAAITSGLSMREVDITLDNFVYGDFKLLYLSPERLGTDIVIARLAKMNINLFAVDEAHCISQWGYDFRPSYLKIADIKPHINNAPILALTATATKQVKDDIIDKLELKTPDLFQGSFERKNISYVVRKAENKPQQLLRVLNKVPGSSIVYVKTRRKTKEIAEQLFKHNISADYYHAGLDINFRHQKQQKWQEGNTRVIVSTNAFGMGVDKPNVRTVIHIDIPDNLESYYQEAGRVGRDGKKSYAVLLYNQSDVADAKSKMEDHFPSYNQILNTYNALGNYFKLAIGSGEGQEYNFEISQFCNAFNLDIRQTLHALKLLAQQEYILLNEGVYTPSKLQIIVDRETLYKFQIANAKFDKLIKYLLRSQHGIFDDPINVNEKQIARILSVSKEAAEQQLTFLAGIKLINYIKNTGDSKITYITGRQDVKYLKLDKDFIELRRNVHISNLKAIIDYTLNDGYCRSRFILDYFGETDNTACGTCDICLKDKKLNIDGFKEQIITELKTALSHKALGISELTDRLEQFSPETIISTVRTLLDEGEIVEHDNTYFWKQDK